jgi:adenine phosphoribosyltransferase
MSRTAIEKLSGAIRDVPDFPKPGIVFKDITPLLGDPELFSLIGDVLADPFRSSGVDKVVGIDARGFIFASQVAERLKAGFVPVRKMGKLPFRTMRRSYALEYGEDHVEIHVDAVKPGQNVLIVDDLLATGGTASAARGLVEEVGGRVVGISFLIELACLGGRKMLGEGAPVESVIVF